MIVASALPAYASIGDIGDVYVAHFWGPDVEQYDPSTHNHEHTYFQTVTGDNGGGVHWLHDSDKVIMTRMTRHVVYWSNPKGNLGGIAVRDPYVSQPMDTALGPYGRLLVANRGTESVTAHIWEHGAAEPERARNVDDEWDLPTKGYPAILLECSGLPGFQTTCPGDIDVLVAVQGNSRDILGLDVDTGEWTMVTTDLAFEDGALDMDWHPTLPGRILVGTRLNGLKVLDPETGAFTTLVDGTQIFGAIGESGSGRNIGAIEGVAVNPWLGEGGTIVVSDRCEACLSENRLMNFRPDGTFLAEYAVGDFTGDLAVRLPEPTTWLLFAAILSVIAWRRHPALRSQ